MTPPEQPLQMRPGLYVRPKRRRAQPEQAFQRDVVNLLRMMLSDTAVVFHVPNGGHRALLEAKRLKAMGTLAGIPDLAILDGGRVYWLEAKAGRGKPSEAQIACHAALQRAGSPVAVVRTIDDVLTAIRDWGIGVRGTWSIPGSVTVGHHPA